jgi:transposase
MISNTFYVGLDLGSSHCYQVVMNEAGKIIRSRPIPTCEQNLRVAFQGFDADLLVHTEAGELANWVCGIIKPLVKRVVVSHPRSLAWIAKDSRKCDKLDARKLADLLRSNLTHEVFLPETEARRAFKQLVRHYDEATRAQAKLKAKLKARLRCQGIIRCDAAVFSKQMREAVLAPVKDKFLRRMFEELFATLDHLLEDLKQAKQLMLEAARQFPEIKLLQTAPGVGQIGACRFVAYIQNPQRFSNKRKLWRYCRLGVAHRSSDGKLLSHPRLDKNGCGALKDVSRKAFEAAMRCLEDNSFKRAFEQSLATTHDKVHARLSTQRKIVACLRAMWLSNEPYRADLP